MTNLTDKWIRILCKHIVDLEDWSVGEIAILDGVIDRRVRQLTKKHRERRGIPYLDRSTRPRGPPLTKDEKRIIDEVWEEKRLGTRLIRKELGQLGIRIHRHKLHRYLVETSRSVPNLRKQKRYRSEMKALVLSCPRPLTQDHEGPPPRHRVAGRRFSDGENGRRIFPENGKRKFPTPAGPYTPHNGVIMGHDRCGGVAQHEIYVQTGLEHLGDREVHGARPSPVEVR